MSRSYSTSFCILFAQPQHPRDLQPGVQTGGRTSRQRSTCRTASTRALAPSAVAAAKNTWHAVQYLNR